jgi:hypothetical protein
MRVMDWLDALQASRALDPARTPIEEDAGAA